ncbi:MAG: hypothetical protein AB7E49_08375 [Campylobacterales bacterium]
MIQHHLKNAITTLDELIATTQRDLVDIKAARHKALLDRSKLKEDLVSAFEKQKALLDASIARAIDENPERELGDLLSDEEHELLAHLRSSLERLKEENKRFAVMVLTVSEFYNSLLNAILPGDNVGYGSERARSSTPNFLQIKG